MEVLLGSMCRAIVRKINVQVGYMTGIMLNVAIFDSVAGGIRLPFCKVYSKRLTVSLNPKTLLINGIPVSMIIT